MKPLDLSKSFNKFIQIIVTDTINGIKRGTQFGKPFKPNAESTIKQKGHRQPLQGKNRNGVWLQKGKYEVEKATDTKQRASVTIPDAEIALINQTSRTHPRPFWGISEKAAENMNKDVNDDIRKYLKQVDNALLKQGFKKI